MSMHSRKTGRRKASREIVHRHSRSFAVKGVLRFVWTYPTTPARNKVWFECRIVRIGATSEEVAVRKAHRLFSAEVRRGTFFGPEPVVQAVSYLGVERVLEFGEVGMEGNELWWEFVDQRPRITERPGAPNHRKPRH